MEKIFKNKVIPVIKKPAMRVALMIPGLRQIICSKIRAKLIEALGGKVRSVIIGGASLSKSVEKAMRMIRFPYTVGYGMTECAPLIGYEDWKHFVKRSCGKPVAGMSVRVDSENQREKVGEIQVKGDNVTIGYFRNTEATAAAFTEDGWFRTGDLGVIDRNGNIFIRGRSKAMILSASGQNIYPEEIEDLLGELPMVAESLIVERNKGRLVALVYPDTAGKPMTEALKAEVEKQMAENLVLLNEQLPNYSKVAAVEIVDREFEKTPKRSIKRFLYS
jgi:long-chain acyl-CoA synthetase